MRDFEKNRTRLLVISKDRELRNDLVAVLTGYGYFVDYVENRSEGITKFRQHKQAIVIFDMHALPRFPKRMFRIFSYFQRNPIILIAAHKEDEVKATQYLSNGAYDILQLPLNVQYLKIVLGRMVVHNRFQSRYEFLSFVAMLSLLVLPLWILLLYIIYK